MELKLTPDEIKFRIYSKKMRKWIRFNLHDLVCINPESPSDEDYEIYHAIDYFDNIFLEISDILLKIRKQ